MARTVCITSVTIACTACGDQVRVDSGLVDNVVAAGALWMVTHQAAEVVGVETECEGQTAEWVAT